MVKVNLHTKCLRTSYLPNSQLYEHTIYVLANGWFPNECHDAIMKQYEVPETNKWLSMYLFLLSYPCMWLSSSWGKHANAANGMRPNSDARIRCVRSRFYT